MATAVAAVRVPALCQSRRGNIVVDTFTEPAPARIPQPLDAVWDLVYAASWLMLRSGFPSARSKPPATAPPPWCSACRSGPPCRSRAAVRRRGAGHARDAISPHSRPDVSGLPPAALGFAAMLLLIAIRMPVGLAMLADRQRRLCLPVELAGVLRLHEGQPLPPVRQLHALGHPAVHSDGRVGRALGPGDRPLCGGAQPRQALRGGLAMALIGACTVFGAICGSSVATTATFGARGAAGVSALSATSRASPPAPSRSAAWSISHPAVHHPRRLCHHDRAEHRQAVHGRAHPGSAGRHALFASLSRSWCGLRPHFAPAAQRAQASSARRAAGDVAGHALIAMVDRRHLRRHLHADGSRRRGLRRHAGGGAGATAAGLARVHATACCRRQRPRP